VQNFCTILTPLFALVRRLFGRLREFIPHFALCRRFKTNTPEIWRVLPTLKFSLAKICPKFQAIRNAKARGKLKGKR